MVSDTIYRLCYPHLRRWFMCRLGLDCDNNFDIIILPRCMYHMSNESIMSIVARSFGVVKVIG